MTWQMGLGLASVVVMAFVSIKILDALERLNKQVENVRYYLGQLETRQQRMADKLHGIECHTERAVKDAYAQDRWRDQQPPI